LENLNTKLRICAARKSQKLEMTLLERGPHQSKAGLTHEVNVLSRSTMFG
jgi:hypothetical protein